MATKRPTRRAQPSPKAKAAEPEQADPNFVMHPDGSLSWRMGNKTYELQMLTAGDLMDLSRRLTIGPVESAFRATAAADLPATNLEEQQAKLVALREAAAVTDEWWWDWWDRLFRASCGEPFPRDDAPGWLLKRGSTVMDKVLGHLTGPLPPGVS